MSNSSALLDELPGLSDDDVNLLYQITSIAAQSHDPPFRALFAAYDQVLAENGIAAEHDQIYFRYLLRLGEGPTTKNNRRLVARLKGLLRRLDIDIVDGSDEFTGLDEGAEGGGRGDSMDKGDSEEEEEEEEQARLLDQRYAIRPSPNRARDREADARAGKGSRRRVSFNDSHLEETWVSNGRLDIEVAPLRIGKLAGNADAASKPLPRAANGNATADARAGTQPRAQGSTRSARHSRARSLSTQGSVRYGRSASVERYGNDRPAPRYRHELRAYERDRRRTSRDRFGQSLYAQTDNVSPNNPYDQHDSLDELSITSDLDYLSSSPPAPHPPAPAYIPEPVPVPVEQLFATADAFYNTTTFRTARQVLHHLHDQAIRVRQARNDMCQIATNYDVHTLYNQALSSWRTALRKKQQAAETDRLYERVEEKATKARNDYLLNKAFTHWAQSASDEVARTNVAKRHILRTRYFNAWRDVTAVNELKCRRVGLRKSFSLWRDKTARKAVEGERAVALYEEKLVKRIYWTWFWNFCDKRAPLWKDTRLKRSTLLRLADQAAHDREMEDTAIDMRNYHLTRRALSALASQVRSVAALDAQAIEHRRTTLQSLALNTLQKHSQLAPLWRQNEQATSARLAAKVIHIWAQHASLARQAVAADQKRLLRNAVTKWNDNLRISAITTMQDERIKAETWYKWMLFERYTLFRRITAYRLLERTLEKMSTRLAEQRFKLGEAELIYQQGHRRRLLQSVMLKLNRGARNEEHMERLATEFRNQHVMRDILPTWRSKHDHLQQLEQWSVDARFYCLTHSAIGRWREAATNAKKVRRRDAYTTVRRRVKTRLVQNCFAHWRQRTSTATSMDVQASEQYQDRLFSIGTVAFDTWRNLTVHVGGLTVQSEAFYLQQLFATTVSRLTSRGAQILQNHQEAQHYATQTVHLSLKSEMMRRMKWELFCFKRNKENAAALQDRNAQQHRKNMLRYWAEQAVQRKNMKRDLILDPESPTKTPSLFSSMRLPSARKPPPSIRRHATTGQITDATFDTHGEDQDGDLEDDEEMDFGASTTRKAEEWTSYDILKDFAPLPSQVSTTPATAARPVWNLPTLNEESEPSSGRQTHQPQSHSQSQMQGYTPFATPLPGYLRTPSKRTARQRTRFKSLAPGGSIQRPASAFASLPSAPKDDLLDFSEPEQEVVINPRGNVLTSTTPAPLRAGNVSGMGALTPQVTPFERKMRAGGFGSSARSTRSTATAVRTGGAGGILSTPGFGRSRFGRSILSNTGAGGATGRSVRFFDGVGDDGDEERSTGLDGAHEKSS